MKKEYRLFSKNRYKKNGYKKSSDETNKTNIKNIVKKKTAQFSKIVKNNLGKSHVLKKYSGVAVALLMVIVFVVVLGGSYAFFTTTVKGKEFVIYTGTLAVDYTKKTDVINLEDLYPMTNSEGLNQTAHEFTVTNTGNITARYQVRLELDNTIKNMIPVEYVKLSYSMDGGEYSTPVLLSDLGSSLVFVKNVILEKTKSNTIGIKLWVDLNAPNDIQGKEFKAKVVVDSIQNVEDGYIVDTVPIITLNKDKSGNQDINLKLNDSYTELGVASVEDDKDIFTVSEVSKTYEYYDGSNLSTVDSIDTSKTGIYYITYSITDSEGNIGRNTRIVTVNNSDKIPSITLNGNSSISLGERDYYNEEGVIVTDNNKVIVIGEVKTAVVGTYVVKYIVVDSNNNLNSVIRTVVVNKAYKELLLNGADPVLTSNLIPIQIADDGVVTKVSSASTWHDYENKQWANAVVLKDTSITYSNNEIIPESNIESYFVWIPKYSYQLWDLGDYSSLTSVDNTKPHAIPIKFGTTNTSDSVDGECEVPMNDSGTQALAGESGSCQVGDYMTHPAFLIFNSNGFWAGKFDTGYYGATSTETAQIDSSDSSKIVIKPNVYSWRSVTLGNMFKASFDYLRSDESHMMKNTEWGAIAYLSHSLYGTCTETECNQIRANNYKNYVTGYAGNVADGARADIENVSSYNTEIGYLASTTQNITGIYDMSGGSNNYVMGFTTMAEASSDSSGITDLYTDFFTNSKWNKYYDKYSSTTKLDFNNRILGDATGEMGPFSLNTTDYTFSSWYKDYASFANSSKPWFLHGGNTDAGVFNGIFYCTSSKGAIGGTLGFRVVLTP